MSLFARYVAHCGLTGFDAHRIWVVDVVGFGFKNHPYLILTRMFVSEPATKVIEHLFIGKLTSDLLRVTSITPKSGKTSHVFVVASLFLSNRPGCFLASLFQLLFLASGDKEPQQKSKDNEFHNSPSFHNKSYLE